MIPILAPPAPYLHRHRDLSRGCTGEPLICKISRVSRPTGKDLLAWVSRGGPRIPPRPPAASTMHMLTNRRMHSQLSAAPYRGPSAERGVAGSDVALCGLLSDSYYANGSEGPSGSWRPGSERRARTMWLRCSPRGRRGSFSDKDGRGSIIGTHTSIATYRNGNRLLAITCARPRI